MNEIHLSDMNWCKQKIDELQAENAALKAELDKANQLIERAFVAHPNLDIDIEFAIAKVPEGWVALNDVQWMNIVNHENAWEYHSKEDTVHMAVKMTEEKLREINSAAPKLAQCNCQQGQVCPVCDPDLVPAQAEKQDPNTFQRELRYEVRKLKTGKLVDCVVVEADWPEYETVWKMIQDRVEGKKQEPVKDEPVAWMSASGKSFVHNDDVGDSVPNWTDYYTVPLYTRPQPETKTAGYWRECHGIAEATNVALRKHIQDRTAEVERLKAERDSFCMNYRMKCDLETKQQAQRIAALEEAAREARDALQYHTAQTRPIFNTVEAIAKLDAVLGNV